MGDAGLACALLGIDALALSGDRDRLGPLLETFVLPELRRQASWHPDPVDFFHYRDRDGFEVDIVLERGSASVAGRRFASGVVLYDGATAIRFGDDLFAIPLRFLWGES